MTSSASELTLVIGTKNYSSWSFRPWLALKHLRVPFREQVVHLGEATTRPAILQHSPSGRVPVLLHGKVRVWDSLAICEYLAERFPEAGLWPRDVEARAVARAVSAEMHAGFQALRNNMPMNVRARKPGRGRGAGVDEDVQRLQELVEECRTRFGAGGPFLFGAFSIADAMFAPVVSRFVTYGVELRPMVKAWADPVWDLPPVREWREACEVEGHVLPKYEQT
ncbi:MAG: glutathione S-transferase family protein [Myxococcaceae bacterium]|nr:glutathione S-transferase family protein [Myxococcaceae bacterium]